MNKTNAGRLLRRMLVFSLAPLISAVASLVSLPALTARFGPEAWGAVAIGLSVGAAASVVVELGWGLDGPPRVSGSPATSRRFLFALSLTTKLAALPLPALLVMAAAYFLVEQYRLEAALAGLSGIALGLNSNWYFTGTGSPFKMILSDGLPKMLFAIGSAIAIYLGAPMITYPVALALGSLTSPITAAALVLGIKPIEFRYITIHRTLVAFRGQLTALRGRAANTIYFSLPTTLLSLVTASAVPLFAAVDRLQRMLLTLLQVLPNTVLSWATEVREPRIKLRRVKAAVALNTAVGLVASLAWVAALPLAAQVVFAGEIKVPASMLAGSAGMILVTVVSRAVGGIALVAFNGVRFVSDASIAGAIVGTISILILGASYGAEGALYGLLSAEVTALLWQLVALNRILQNHRV